MLLKDTYMKVCLSGVTNFFPFLPPPPPPSSSSWWGWAHAWRSEDNLECESLLGAGSIIFYCVQWSNWPMSSGNFPVSVSHLTEITGKCSHTHMGAKNSNSNLYTGKQKRYPMSHLFIPEPLLLHANYCADFWAKSSAVTLSILYCWTYFHSRFFQPTEDFS